MLCKHGVLNLGNWISWLPAKPRNFPLSHPVPHRSMCFREANVLRDSWHFKALTGTVIVTKTQSPMRRQVKLRMEKNQQMEQKGGEQTVVEHFPCARGFIHLVSCISHQNPRCWISLFSIYRLECFK